MTASVQRFSLIVFAATTIASGVVRAEEPLHRQIDSLIEDAAGDLPVAEVSDDAEFFRRVNLDFAGLVPASDEVRKFLADKAPDKRMRAIEALLKGPRYAQRMKEAFHVHLMERRGKDDVWLAWLEKSFAENKPWDQMSREMIRADFRDEPNRGAAYFMARRLEKYGQNPTDYPGLTRDVGRLFLGMDLQCAECHNHLMIKDYDQIDFQGLMATFSNLKLQRTEYPAVEESLMKKKIEYASVFTGKQREIGPRIPGLEEIPIPELKKGEEYVQVPDRKTKTAGIPKFSPLAEFAAQLPESPNFSKNIVNRLWFLMMGRGLVNPMDQFHTENPPSHPELLDLLASAFVEEKYDIKWLLRELALTKTYQRSSILPDGVDRLPEERFLVAAHRRLPAESFLWSLLRATGNQPEEVPLENVESEEEDGEDFIGLRERFHQALANEARDPEREFSPSLRAALFMMNDPEVQKLLESGEDSLVPRLAGLDADKTVAEELFLSVFGRLPDESELAEAAGFLEKQKGDRKDAIRQLSWAMLTSTEFVVNH